MYDDRIKENEKVKVVIKKDDGNHEFDVKQGGNGEIIDKDDENHKKVDGIHELEEKVQEIDISDQYIHELVN